MALYCQIRSIIIICNYEFCYHNHNYNVDCISTHEPCYALPALRCWQNYRNFLKSINTLISVWTVCHCFHIISAISRFFFLTEPNHKEFRSHLPDRILNYYFVKISIDLYCTVARELMLK